MSDVEAGPEVEAEVEVEPVETDELRSGLLATLEAELGDAVVDSYIKPGTGLWVRVAADAWATAGEVALTKLGCAWFDFVSAIDWMPSPFGRYEDAEIDTSETLADKVAKEVAYQAAERAAEEPAGGVGRHDEERGKGAIPRCVDDEHAAHLVAPDLGVQQVELCHEHGGGVMPARMRDEPEGAIVAPVAAADAKHDDLALRLRGGDPVGAVARIAAIDRRRRGKIARPAGDP